MHYNELLGVLWIHDECECINEQARSLSSSLNYEIEYSCPTPGPFCTTWMGDCRLAGKLYYGIGE